MNSLKKDDQTELDIGNNVGNQSTSKRFIQPIYILRFFKMYQLK
ncbi:hypothetical protein HJ01_03560 [Flavobacterium frigoris PS1]|uniref:Uncharacterized protein n=1 Tax=Flavobacterium frigoris (strain PS1) TaxID=1086011 RepID=H7FWL6_FLAFP|nr:hypothetical protein HJ01_03560 [Flavobacterium frigoris PS1]